jgi:hypothetical protein
MLTFSKASPALAVPQVRLQALSTRRMLTSFE